MQSSKDSLNLVLSWHENFGVRERIGFQHGVHSERQNHAYSRLILAHKGAPRRKLRPYVQFPGIHQNRGGWGTSLTAQDPTGLDLGSEGGTLDGKE